MAIDIEELSLGREGAIKSQLSPAEIKFFGGLQYGYIMAWTIKEALSKVLLTGLTTSFLIYEISEIIAHQGMYVAKFHNFPQYQVLTFCQNNIILSLVLPKQLQIDQASILQLQKLFC
jgi:phosphopantetheinyl transferase (holo-ACP synthase)